MDMTIADLFSREAREEAASRPYAHRHGDGYTDANRSCVVGALFWAAGVAGSHTPTADSAVEDWFALLARPEDRADPERRAGAARILSRLIEANDRGAFRTRAAVRRALLPEQEGAA